MVSASGEGRTDGRTAAGRGLVQRPGRECRQRQGKEQGFKVLNRGGRRGAELEVALARRKLLWGVLEAGRARMDAGLRADGAWLT